MFEQFGEAIKTASDHGSSNLDGVITAEVVLPPLYRIIRTDIYDATRSITVSMGGPSIYKEHVKIVWIGRDLQRLVRKYPLRPGKRDKLEGYKYGGGGQSYEFQRQYQDGFWSGCDDPRQLASSSDPYQDPLKRRLQWFLKRLFTPRTRTV